MRGATELSTKMDGPVFVTDILGLPAAPTEQRIVSIGQDVRVASIHVRASEHDQQCGCNKVRARGTSIFGHVRVFAHLADGQVQQAFEARITVIATSSTVRFFVQN